MWRELNGNGFYYAGASGTVTIPDGYRLLQVHAHTSGAGSVTIFGGAAIPVPTTGWGWQIQHLMWVAGSKQFNGNNDIIFAGTDAYFIEVLIQPGSG